jgi:excisionase family DNA binding protein
MTSVEEWPAICRRDGCAEPHWHPVTGEPPAYHWLGNGDPEPRYSKRIKPADAKARYWTVGEVADKVAVCPKTVQRWILTGKLVASKTGTSRTCEWRIRGADLEDFLKRQRNINLQRGTK